MRCPHRACPPSRSDINQTTVHVDEATETEDNALRVHLVCEACDMGLVVRVTKRCQELYL